MVIYDDQHSQYIVDLFVPQDEALMAVQQAHALPDRSLQPEEGRFLQFLVRASGAEKALEIGTLGGHSGIWIARGLVPGGKLITLELEPKIAEVARQNFEAAGVSELVDLRIGDAHELLELLRNEGPFDFVFIDAEKIDYMTFFNWALENIRIGGVITAHNAFRRGTVLGAQEADFKTEALRAFNRRVASEPQVISTIYPGGDGMVVAVKIS